MRPGAIAGPNTEWYRHLTRIGKEVGDVFERAEHFLEDGDIDHLEAPDLLKEIDDLLAAAADLRAAVRARLTDGA